MSLSELYFVLYLNCSENSVLAANMSRSHFVFDYGARSLIRSVNTRSIREYLHLLDHCLNAAGHCKAASVAADRKSKLTGLCWVTDNCTLQFRQILTSTS